MNKNKFNFILIVILLIPAVHLYAQGIEEYYGTVKDSKTNKTISNVNVFIKDSNIGTTTGSSGGFVLHVDNPDARMVIVFRHVGYDLLEISVDDIDIPLDIFLTPRIIPLSEFKVKGKRITAEYQKDLPLSISVIESQVFELRGFDDVGDLLRNEQSVQVEDELSGRKTISLRGGNADETIVLYNGIKLNSLYNNIADISLIDLQDISRIEVIRGSNTVIYGSDAIAGVVNLVPRLGEGNHIRFKQKIGSYDTGQWTLNLNGNAGNFSGFLSARQSASRRLFSGEAALNPELKNQSSHYTTNVKYRLGSNDDGEDAIFATAMITARDYENDRDEELLSNDEQLYSTRFIGDLPGLSDIELKTYIKYFEQTHEVKSSIGTLRRELKEDSFNLGIEKLLNLGNIEQRIVYQFER
ncbi:MAG: TonB-dependent receptor plug domain-containing protein, partial [Candidatus Marinimicrobia bacterium]|nr:TonB-dependent receptor plug domain-containing protein [Candidatus Neomarinimicrobiota bacterium]